MIFFVSLMRLSFYSKIRITQNSQLFHVRMNANNIDNNGAKNFLQVGVLTGLYPVASLLQSELYKP